MPDADGWVTVTKKGKKVTISQFSLLAGDFIVFF